MHCDVDDDKGWRKLFDGLLDRSKLQTHVSQDTPPTMPACVTTMVMMMMVVVIDMNYNDITKWPDLCNIPARPD